MYKLKSAWLLITMTALLLLFATETAAQSYTLTRSINAAGDVVTYSGSYLDSATYHTTYDIFSLGDYYNFTSYPVKYVVKLDTNSAYGNAAQVPKVTCYIDASYDNTNWLEKVDTLFSSDSVITRHSGGSNFNSVQAKYYKPTVYTGAGRDSINFSIQFYFKKE